MAKTRQQKKTIVDTLTKALSQAKLIVLSEIKGLTVAETTALRSDIRKERVKHEVVKISLFKLALRKAGIPTDHLQLNTQIAVSYSDDDTAAARILKNFSKTNEKLKLVGGYLDRLYLNHAQVVELAGIPSRVDLLSQLVSVLAGPMRGLITVLSGPQRGLVQVLSQVKK